MGEKKYFETGDFLQMATFIYYKGLKQVTEINDHIQFSMHYVCLPCKALDEVINVVVTDFYLVCKEVRDA